MSQNHKKLRIGFVSTMSGVPWGGSEELWSEAARHLIEAGHDVRASVYRWPERPAQLTRLIEAGAKLAFRVKRRGPFGRFTQKCLHRFATGSLELAHERWLQQGRFDLVVISQGGPWDGVPWMIACHRLGLRYCTIVHANGEQWWPLDSQLEGIHESFSHAQRVYFVSHANQRLMELQCGTRFPHGEVVANPSKIDRRRASQVPWPEATDVFQMACVGRMTPSAKGQDLLFEVLSQQKWKDRPLRVNLYGSGPSEKSLRGLAAYFGLKQVHFAGFVSDVRSIWNTNHLLVLPSRFEGLPIAIVEAMLCGRAVVTTDIAGNTELVHDDVNGFVAAAPTVPLLDEALERAWAARDRWQAMGAEAFRTALDALPLDPVGEFTAKLLSLATPPSATKPPRGPGALRVPSQGNDALVNVIEAAPAFVTAFASLGN